MGPREVARPSAPEERLRLIFLPEFEQFYGAGEGRFMTARLALRIILSEGKAEQLP